MASTSASTSSRVSAPAQKERRRLARWPAKSASQALNGSISNFNLIPLIEMRRAMAPSALFAAASLERCAWKSLEERRLRRRDPLQELGCPPSARRWRQASSSCSGSRRRDARTPSKPSGRRSKAATRGAGCHCSRRSIRNPGLDSRSGNRPIPARCLCSRVSTSPAAATSPAGRSPGGRRSFYAGSRPWGTAKNGN